MNSTNADEPPELHEHLGNSVEARLIDPRVHAAPLAVRPALAVEESGGPGEVVILQPRNLDRTRRACLSSKRAKTSSKCANAVAQMCARPGAGARPRARDRGNQPVMTGIINRLPHSWDRTAAEGA